MFKTRVYCFRFRQRYIATKSDDIEDVGQCMFFVDAETMLEAVKKFRSAIDDKFRAMQDTLEHPENIQNEPPDVEVHDRSNSITVELL